MTLEEKAEEYATESGYTKGSPDFWIVTQGYLAGAKENGVVWHDLRKDPNDLPKDDKKYFIYTNLGNYYFTQFRETYWVGVMTNEFVSNNAVIAWCEIPQFQGVAE